MKGDRLLAIMLLLQNNGKMSAQELADRLEVSKRTVLRDMEALSAAGVPVYAERGPAGGWLLLNDYSTDLTGMKKEELVSLLFGSGANRPALRDIPLRQPFRPGGREAAGRISGIGQARGASGKGTSSY